jgi:hypothetical protein
LSAYQAAKFAVAGFSEAAPGVREKAARVLLALAVMEKQPRRLLLGSDAYMLARRRCRRWRSATTRIAH